VSILPTFYECTKVLCAAFLYLHFGFVIFSQKNIGAKATCTGVNFTNILQTAFSPISFWQKITNPNWKHIKTAHTLNLKIILQVAFLLNFFCRFNFKWREAKTLQWKSCLKNIDVIDIWTTSQLISDITNL